MPRPGPMRVAYVISAFPTSFVASEVEEHRRAGWEVLPLSSSKPLPPDHLSAVEREWLWRTVYRPSVLAQLGGALIEPFRNPAGAGAVLVFLLRLLLADPGELAKALYELGAACRFARNARAFGAAHVHAHFASRSLSLAVMIGLLLGRPVSCTAHAFDIFTRSRRSLALRLGYCRFVACISEYNIRYLRARCGERIGRLCRLVRCGVDPASFAVRSRDPDPGRVVTIGNLIEKKGTDLAIRACARLREAVPRLEFHVVGAGPLRGDLEQLASSLGIGDRVRFLGPLPNDRVAEFLSAASVFLMPCRRGPGGDMDGIPVSMMEAMACGIPVVSTNISGIPELVEDGVSGRLVAEGDVDALAAALGELLGDPALARRMGRAARGKVEREFAAAPNAERLRALIAAAATARAAATATTGG